jgi:hypothetical protein
MSGLRQSDSDRSGNTSRWHSRMSRGGLAWHTHGKGWPDRVGHRCQTKVEQRRGETARQRTSPSQLWLSQRGSAEQHDAGMTCMAEIQGARTPQRTAIAGQRDKPSQPTRKQATRATPGMAMLCRGCGDHDQNVQTGRVQVLWRIYVMAKSKTSNPTLTPTQGPHPDSINSAKTWNGCLTIFVGI